MDQAPSPVATETAETADTLFASASRLHEAGRLEETKGVLNRLLAAHPKHVGGLNLLGITRGQQGDLAAACDLVEQAIALAGEHPVYLRNLCELRRQNDEAPVAVLAGRRAIMAAPSDRIARLNLAMAEQDALELDAADANTRTVLATEPGNGSAHFLLAQLALLRGDFAEGWREYAWRWRIPGAEQPKPPGDVPEWDGAVLDGTLMLMGDQGFGDMIQFARFIPWAEQRCATLAICAPRDLRGLLQRLAPGAIFVADPAQVERIAAHAAFSSLPGLAGAALGSIPAAEGYLTTDPERVRRWSARLDQLAPGPNRRIGLVWAGRREHRADRQRSMALASFAPLFGVSGITFVSVQKGEAVGQVAGYFGPAPLVNLGPELEDFDATAAVLACLDGLVTVDTSVAHLAGALGLRADVLLPFRPDWRWLLGRTDTPWYRGIRLWRDPAPQSRGETVMRLREAI